MKLERMDDGPPGHHRGVGHTLKHYLAPAELWDDLATPEGLAPRDVLSALGPLNPAPHRQFKYPGVGLRERWEWLCGVHRDGYFAVVRGSVDPLEAPPLASWRYRPAIGGVRPRPAAYIAATDEGVILIVTWVDRAWEMRTAFRPSYDFGARVLPSDAKSLKRRLSQAKHAARRQVALMLTEVER